MTPSAVKDALVDLERQYWQAIKDKDVATATRLTDDPCIITGSRGVGWIDRRTLERMMSSTTWTLHTFKLSDDVHVRLIGDNVAIVAYSVLEELTVDGKPVTLEAADASTWVQRNGRWVCALHTEAIAGDAFGRDRRVGGARDARLVIPQSPA